MFGFETILVGISILFQGSVAVISGHRALKSFGSYRMTWLILAIVFGLMTFRRTVSLGVGLGFDIPYIFPEVIALTISLLLFIAMYKVGEMLPALENIVKTMPNTSERLKSIAGQLSQEIQSDFVDIDEYKMNGDKLRRSKQSLGDASSKLVDIAHNLERLSSGMPSSKSDSTP